MLGAVVGNVLVGQVKDIFGAYIAVFPYVATIAFLGTIVAVALMKPVQVAQTN